MVSVNPPGGRHVAMMIAELLGSTRAVFFEQEWGGLRPSHLRVLSAVPQGGCTVTELATQVGMTKQGCGQFVTTLVASGHLAESRADADRRVRLASRTPDGDAVLVRAAALMASLEDDWRTAVGPRRYATFRGVLEELSAAGTGSAAGSPPG
jgi:DNA-binding MarR family transcriptional regulator